MLARHAFVVVCAAAVLSGCFAWEEDVERGGHKFSKYREDSKSGIHIGVLAEPVEVDGYVCRGGDWAHFEPDWSLSACFLAEPYEMTAFTVPADTWVLPAADHLTAAFAGDTPCQGYVCSGTGGAKGTQTSFYLDGRLRSFYPPEDVEVDGVLCKASIFNDVRLHENGGLRRCVAAADGEVGGTAFARGDVVKLDAGGTLLNED